MALACDLSDDLLGVTRPPHQNRQCLEHIRGWDGWLEILRNKIIELVELRQFNEVYLRGYALPSKVLLHSEDIDRHGAERTPSALEPKWLEPK
eukprot:CAMPEP_0117493250 /NCGR_PEP_ID=MMETSP0784-20121206/19001_1 /TAXON_ID=39447 /ORGANISM="" /LENGTH=92 /DNA_ID=CAMNT_0005288097 /DNA_START=383 /DNA_END=658 /DNA_ORIENTATION=+